LEKGNIGFHVFNRKISKININKVFLFYTFGLIFKKYLKILKDLKTGIPGCLAFLPKFLK